MTNPTDKILKATQSIDTLDLLDHIAWTNILKPQLDHAKRILTEKLVAQTLGTASPGTETKEQVAGKLYGITYITTMFEKILSQGTSARQSLADENIFIK